MRTYHHHDPLPKPRYIHFIKSKSVFSTWCCHAVLFAHFILHIAQSTTQNKHLRLFKFIYVFLMLGVFLFFSSVVCKLVCRHDISILCTEHTNTVREKEQRNRGDGHHIVLAENRIEAVKLRRRSDHESIVCATLLQYTF